MVGTEACWRECHDEGRRREHGFLVTKAVDPRGGEPELLTYERIRWRKCCRCCASDILPVLAGDVKSLPLQIKFGDRDILAQEPDGSRIEDAVHLDAVEIEDLAQRGESDRVSNHCSSTIEERCDRQRVADIDHGGSHDCNGSAAADACIKQGYYAAGRRVFGRSAEELIEIDRDVGKLRPFDVPKQVRAVADAGQRARSAGERRVCNLDNRCPIRRKSRDAIDVNGLSNCVFAA